MPIHAFGVRKALTALLIVVGSCGPLNAQNRINDASPTFGNQPFVLTEAEHEQFSRSAVDGSREAAVRLGDYYFLVAIDQAKARLWFSIGAENGAARAMHALALILERSSDSLDKARAIFWLKKAVTEGKHECTQVQATKSRGPEQICTSDLAKEDLERLQQSPP